MELRIGWHRVDQAFVKRRHRHQVGYFVMDNAAPEFMGIGKCRMCHQPHAVAARQADAKLRHPWIKADGWEKPHDFGGASFV